MIKSMTGFGRGESGTDLSKIEVEIRSYNSRFLEIKFRGYPLDPISERNIRRTLENSLVRGNVQVKIELNNLKHSNQLTFDKDRFEIIKDVVKEIHVNYGQRMNLSDIISTQDLLMPKESPLIKNADITEAVLKAILQLNEMRLKEGVVLHSDLVQRIENLKILIDNSEKISETFYAEKQIDLRKKVTELLGNDTLDESRLIQEIAYIAERADVTEEIVRCRSHFKQLDEYLNLEDPVGKRIAFLVQEISREVNTIGSKSPQTEVTKNVIEMKNDLEKIREQIQNVL